MLIEERKTDNKIEIQLKRKVKQFLDDFKWIDRILTDKEKENILFKAYALLIEDINSFVDRDPAAKSSHEYVLNSYSCFQALISYRIANSLYYSNKFSKGEEIILQQLARLISEEAKVKTGVEIHPGARIGSGFVIDHGFGTVIGETSVIGRECYLLQGVILGAGGISQNKEGKRHPSIGDEVQIGAFAKILGAITIGNKVFISPGCIITQDIPANSKVIVTNEYQVIKKEKNQNKNKNSIKIYGITVEERKYLQILGENFDGVLISLIDNENKLIKKLEIEVIEREKNRLKCAVKFDKQYRDDLTKIKLKFEIGINNSTILVNSLALRNFLFFNQLKALEQDLV